MDIPKIEKLDELLNNYLGHEKSVTNHESTRLTEIGENYGSQIFALKIQIKNKDENEVLEAVAKMPPPGEFMQRMFNIPVTFRNEIDFYQTVVPEVKSFLEEKKIEDYLDFVPEYFGSRLSLEPNKNEVDDDAVLLLENLKVKGFEMLDRTTGFDYQTSKVVIKALAKYHAGSLGLKILKPEVFNKKIRPLFQPYKVFDFEEMYELALKKNVKIVEDIDSCKQYSDRIKEAFNRTPKLAKNAPELIREPFASVIHTDAWVNNFMVKYQNKVPVDCKIVDFQLGEYGSPVRDLLFVIFTSVQIPVVQKYYDELLEWYYGTVVENLVEFGSESFFSWTEFQDEVELVARQNTVFYSMIMLEPIFASKHEVKELDQYSIEDFAVERVIPTKHKERAEFLVHEFVKRNWI